MSFDENAFDTESFSVDAWDILVAALIVAAGVILRRRRRWR